MGNFQRHERAQLLGGTIRSAAWLQLWRCWGNSTLQTSSKEKAFCTFHRSATYKQVGHSCNLFIWVLKCLSKFKLGVCQSFYSQGLLLSLAGEALRLPRLMRAFPVAGECPAFPDSPPKTCLQQSPAAPVPNWGAGIWGLDKQAAFFQSTEYRVLRVYSEGLPGRQGSF